MIGWARSWHIVEAHDRIMCGWKIQCKALMKHTRLLYGEQFSGPILLPSIGNLFSILTSSHWSSTRWHVIKLIIFLLSKHIVLCDEAWAKFQRTGRPSVMTGWGEDVRSDGTGRVCYLPFPSSQSYQARSHLAQQGNPVPQVGAKLAVSVCEDWYHSANLMLEISICLELGPGVTFTCTNYYVCSHYNKMSVCGRKPPPSPAWIQFTFFCTLAVVVINWLWLIVVSFVCPSSCPLSTSSSLAYIPWYDRCILRTRWATQ